jgi:hypothetical protein
VREKVERKERERKEREERRERKERTGRKGAVVENTVVQEKELALFRLFPLGRVRVRRRRRKERKGALGGTRVGASYLSKL